MAEAFNLIATINVQGPVGLSKVMRRIQTGLGNVATNVDINIPRKTQKDMQNLNKGLGEIDNNLGQTGRAAARTSKEVNNLNNSVSAAANSVGKTAKESEKATKGMNNVAQSTNTATNAMAEFGRISALAVRRFLAFSIPAGIVLGLVAGIKQGVAAAIDFERQMIKVEQVTGKSAASLSVLNASIDRMATTFGTASEELADVSRILSQAGFDARETRIALDALAKSTLAPTFTSITNTAEGAVAGIRQFGFEVDELENKLGSINAVAGSFAVESDDIVAAIRRAGGAFQAAGGNIEELIALFTSVRSTTRESAQSIATGFRTIFTRIQRPRTLEYLKQFGIELQDAERQFVGPYEAVRRLNAALSELKPTDVRYSQIIEQLGGFRQVSKVIPLIQQFGESQKALAVAQAGVNSVNEDAILAQETLSVKIDTVYQSYQKLFRTIAGSDTFKTITNSAVAFAKALANILDNLEPLIPMLATIAGLKLASLGTRFVTGFAPALGANIGKTNTELFSQTELKTGGRLGLSKGGSIPGGGSRDTVPAMLTPGEFVINKKAAQKIGKSNLTRLNQTGSIQKFQTGGPVGNLGSGAFGNIIGISLLGGFIGSLGEAEGKLQEWSQGLTKTLITFETMRALGGTFQGIGQDLKGAFSKNFLQRAKFYVPSQSQMLPPLAPYSGMSALPAPQRLGMRARLRGLKGAFRGGGAGVAGILSTVAATGVGMYAGSQQKSILSEARDASKTQSEIRELERRSGRTSMLGVGSQGVAIGAGVGMMFGPVGALIGAAVGGIGGAIVGAFRDGADEVRAAFRDAKFQEASQELSSSLNQLNKGEASVLGGELRDVGGALREQLSTLYSAETEKEQTQFSKQLRSLLPALINQQQSMIQAIAKQGGGLQAFRQAGGGAGQAMIRAMAEIRGTNTTLIENEIKKELQSRKKAIDIMNKEADARTQLIKSANIVSEFNTQLLLSTDKLAAFDNTISVAFDSLQGRFNIPKFTGQNALRQISLAKKGRGNIADLRGGLQQTFGGLGPMGRQVTQQTVNTAQFIKELPQLLEKSMESGMLESEQDIVGEVGKQLEKYEGVLGAGELADIVMSNLQGIMREPTTGIPKFQEGVTQDPRGFAKELLGKPGTKFLNEIENAMKNMVSASNQYVKNLQQIKEQEIKVLKSGLKELTQYQRERKEIFELRNIGETYSFGQAQRDMSVRQANILSGTGLGPGASADAIIRELRGTQQQAVVAERRFQEAQLGGDEGSIKAAANELGNLKEKSFRLQTALENMTNVTARAAAIRNELNQLEETRKTKFGLVNQYMIGGTQERARLDRTAANLKRLGGGEINLEQLTSKQRKEAYSLIQQLGEARTGFTDFMDPQKFWADILQRGLQERNPELAKAFGEQARPDKRTKQEDNLINKLDDLYKKRHEVRMKILSAQQQTVIDLKSLLETQFNSFIEDLRNSLIQSRKEQLVSRRDKLIAQRGQAESSQAEARKVAAQIGKRVGIDDPVKVQALIEKVAEFATRDTTRASAAGIRQFEDLKADSEAKNKVAKYINDAISGATTTRTQQTPGFGGSTTTVSTTEYSRGKAKRLLAANKEFRDMLSGAMTPEQIEGFIDSIAQLSEFEQGKRIQDPSVILAQQLDTMIQSFKEEAKKATGISNVKQFDFLMKSALAKSTDTINELNTKISKLNIDGFDKVIKDFANNIAKLNNAINALDNVPGRAAGGPIFAPRGTDTVPAMLTPGEFVVNRDATRKNMDLLHAINNGKTTVSHNGIRYVQGGGQIPDDIRKRIVSIAWQAGKNKQGLTEAQKSFIDTLTPGQRKYGSKLFKKYRDSQRHMQYQAPLNIQEFNDKDSERFKRRLISLGRKLGSGKLMSAADSKFYNQYVRDDKKSYNFAQQVYNATKSDVGVTRFNARRQYELEMRRRRMAFRRHGGGLVPGAGETNAILQGGEYVLNKADVQRLNKGGIVQYKQGGGITGSTDGLAIILDEGAKKTLNDFSSKLNTFSDKLVNTANVFEKTSNTFANQIESLSGNIKNLTTNIADIPESIQVQIDNGRARQETNNTSPNLDPMLTLSDSLNNVGPHFVTFSDAVNNLGSYMQQFNSGIATFAQAMQTELQISVQHSPIQVNVTVENNGETTIDENSQQTIAEIARQAIGPELDDLRNNIREYGPGGIS